MRPGLIRPAGSRRPDGPRSPSPPPRRRRPLLLDPRDGTAPDAVAGVARGLGGEVVGPGVDDDRPAEDVRRPAAADGPEVRRHGEDARAVGPDLDVPDVAEVELPVGPAP